MGHPKIKITRKATSSYRIEPASVSTNTSCSRPRSRAEGVRIVFGPMKIFSLRVIARRTSFSLTKGEISTAGFAGGSGFDRETVGTGASAFAVFDPAEED